MSSRFRNKETPRFILNLLAPFPPPTFTLMPPRSSMPRQKFSREGIDVEFIHDKEAGVCSGLFRRHKKKPTVPVPVVSNDIAGDITLANGNESTTSVRSTTLEQEVPRAISADADGRNAGSVDVVASLHEYDDRPWFT